MNESKSGAACSDGTSGGMGAALTPGLSLVERLRKPIAKLHVATMDRGMCSQLQTMETDPLRLEAADEIERLSNALSKDANLREQLGRAWQFIGELSSIMGVDGVPISDEQFNDIENQMREKARLVPYAEGLKAALTWIYWNVESHPDVIAEVENRCLAALDSPPQMGRVSVSDSHPNETLAAIPSEWLQPGGVVPVDAQTTAHLLKFIRQLLARPIDHQFAEVGERPPARDSCASCFGMLPFHTPECPAVCKDFAPGADPSRCLYCGVNVESHVTNTSEGK